MVIEKIEDLPNGFIPAEIGFSLVDKINVGCTKLVNFTRYRVENGEKVFFKKIRKVEDLDTSKILVVDIKTDFKSILDDTVFPLRNKTVLLVNNVDKFVIPEGDGSFIGRFSRISVRRSNTGRTSYDFDFIDYTIKFEK